MHEGENHVVATNRVLLNLRELALKMGIVASTPGASAGVLRRTASGQSGWGPVQPTDVAPGSDGEVLMTLAGVADWGAAPTTAGIRLAASVAANALTLAI